jgi:hypothetical protein
MNKYKSLSRSTIEKVCKNVCSRFQPWGSQLIDTDALYFTLYWQICALQNKRMDLEIETGSQMLFFREELQMLFNDMVDDPTEIMSVVSDNIEQTVTRHYREEFVSKGC